jgi:hypothetical protein
MNDYDKNNLKFIMALTQEEFEVWYAEISDDDAEYAMELLKKARQALVTAEMELLDEVETFTEAKNILDRFTLKGKV